MTNKELFLETADKIGNRLIKTALRDGGKYTWHVMAPDRENPQLKKAKQELAGGAVYQGTAGIVLFLNELSKYSDNKEKILKTTEGAIKLSIEEGESLPNNSFGFHSGRVGIAYASALFALASGKEEYLKEAERLLLPLKGNEEKDYGWDVIGGAAGAVPALLIINEHLKNDLALSIAENLGNNLIQKANMEPAGWSWGGGNTNYRNLCGLAHGAAGAGHAFMELYNYTGLSKYLYAAEQAFLYERQFFNEGLNNWPDFRYSELSEYIYYNKIDELKEAVKNGTLPAYETKYMSAWCHGAPGIGLTRLRVFELTKNDVYKKEALEAIEGTKLSIMENKLSNYSLCHGIGGNSEALIYGYEILNDNGLLKIAEDIALNGIEKFEKNNIPWPCGTMNSVSDPSLMLGEAGIGYYFLRLFDQKITSVLLPSRRVLNNNVLEEDDSFKGLQKDYINYYFGNTIRLLNEEIISPNLVNLQKPFHIGQTISDAENNFQELKTILALESVVTNQILKETFIKEKTKYELTSAINDYSEEYVEELKRETSDEINFEDYKLEIMPFVKLTDSNLFEETESADEEIENYTLFFRKQNKIYTRELNILSYLILKSLEKPATLENVISKVVEFVELENNSEIKSLRKTIIQQIEEFYKAQLIKISERNRSINSFEKNESYMGN